MSCVEWKPVKGYEGLYEVSNDGRIKALKKRVDRGKCHREWEEHFLKQAADMNGYLRTSLAMNGKNTTIKVHRLVAETFIPNPENKPEVNHIDGNKQNNDVSNLEWCTRSENLKHACKHKLKRLDGEHNPAHVLTKEDVDYIRNVYMKRHPVYGASALAKQFNVDRHAIWKAVSMRTWKEGE